MTHEEKVQEVMDALVAEWQRQDGQPMGFRW